MEKTAIQFGAGNIGRGFLAQLFTSSGYRVIFVEVDGEIIEHMNRRKEYTLKIVGANPRNIKISGVSALNAAVHEPVAEALARADIAATAVGANALPGIAPLIAAGIRARAEAGGEPLNIIICENLLRAGAFLKAEVRKHLSEKHFPFLEEQTGFVESVVSRMIPVVQAETRKRDPLFVAAEEYAVLPVALESFRGGLPDISGFLPTANFPAYEERKLFVHNLGHAVCAYRGFEKGMEYIWQAVRDPGINELLRKTLDESASALIIKHGFGPREMSEHIEDLTERFGNLELGDTVARVGRDPLRKLGPGDRLIGSAKNCIEQGVEPANIVKSIVSALKYRAPEDEQAIKLGAMLESEGLDSVLTRVCGITEEEGKLRNMIKNAWEKEVQDESGSLQGD